ncbi:MAG: hypothetical protein WCI18_15680 [Pseudomonadota bacterium]
MHFAALLPAACQSRQTKFFLEIVKVKETEAFADGLSNAPAQQLFLGHISLPGTLRICIRILSSNSSLPQAVVVVHYLTDISAPP